MQLKIGGSSSSIISDGAEPPLQRRRIATSSYSYVYQVGSNNVEPANDEEMNGLLFDRLMENGSFSGDIVGDILRDPNRAEAIANALRLPQPIISSAMNSNNTIDQETLIYRNVPLHPGQIVPQTEYKLLNRGGFGAIYKIEWILPYYSLENDINEIDQSSLKRIDAVVKIAAEDSTAEKSALRRELSKLYELKRYGPNGNDFHPGIVKYYAFINDFKPTLNARGTLGIVLEYAKYGSLHDVIAKFHGHYVDNVRELKHSREASIKALQAQEPQLDAEALANRSFIVQSDNWIPISLAISWMMQVAGALLFIHLFKNNQHKDIKTANILLRGDLSVAICDLGFMSTKQSLDSTNGPTRLMSEIFNAPERRMHSPSGPLSDMFGFGVFAFQLITQEQPDKGMLSPSIMKGRYDAFYKSRSSVHPEYALLLTQLYEHIIEPCIQFEMNCRKSSVLVHREFSNLYNSHDILRNTMTDDVNRFLSILHA